jgi:cytochrome c peroxidase
VLDKVRPWGLSLLARHAMKSMSPLWRAMVLWSLWIGSVLACSGDVPPPPSDRFFAGAYEGRPTAQQLTELGRKIFLDPRLSASGQQSCASCHSPTHGYGPSNRLSVQLGGPHLNLTGARSTPSLRYLHSPRDFTEHYIDLEDNNGQNAGPAGGRTWDGRVNLARDQALMPFLDPNEMANGDRSDIIARMRGSAYADEFRQAFSAPGQDVFEDVNAALGWLTVAIEYFEQSPADFHPFTSKYDAHLRGEVKLSAQEERGLRWFNEAHKGNCASCHPSAVSKVTGTPPIFTDFEFSALGAPRNHNIPDNRDPTFFDLGLCGPFRTDMRDHPEYCGRFRAPSLRNVAARQSFFHNGVFHSLKEVLDFYVTRDTTPQRWYAKSPSGQVRKFDDLPTAYRRNLKVDAPFSPLPGNRPRLSEAEIRDIIAFLRTLSDQDVVNARQN